MDGGVADRQSGNCAEVRPSRDDRCAECGDPVGHEWVSYEQDRGNPQSALTHFGGIVQTGPVEPRPEGPKHATRDFRYPEDLGVFFHPWCAPGIKLSEKVQEEVASLLADAFVADYRKRVERWARIPDVAGSARDAPRCRAHVASVEARRVFTMTRPEWERLRAQE